MRNINRYTKQNDTTETQNDHVDTKGRYIYIYINHKMQQQQQDTVT
jgi:hypothetical protein